MDFLKNGNCIIDLQKDTLSVFRDRAPIQDRGVIKTAQGFCDLSIGQGEIWI